MAIRAKLNKKADLSDATAVIQEILEDNTDDLVELIYEAVQQELGITDEEYQELMSKIEEAGADIVYDIQDAGFRASAVEVARILIEKVAPKIAYRLSKYM